MINKIGYIFDKKEKLKFVILTIMVVIGSFFELLSISLFSPFIELIMDSEAINDNAVLVYIKNLLSLQKTEDFLTLLAIVIMLVYIIKNIFIIWQKNVIYQFSYGMQRKLSTRLLKAYMHEPYTFHLKKNISELQRSMQEDAGQFANGMLHFMEMVAEVCVCIVIGVYLFIVSKSITVIIVGLLIICLGIFTVITKKYSHEWGIEGQKSKAKIYQWMNQALGGIKEIKVLNRENIFVRNYDEYHGRYVRVLRLNRLIGTMPKYIIEMVSIVGMLVAIIVKMHFGQKELQDFVPQLATFAVAAFRLLPATGRINEHMSAVIYASPSVDLIFHDLKEVEALDYTNKPVDQTWRFDRQLDIKHVSYHYPDSSVNVIEDVSFKIEKGKTVAFIGASGAGKSTMVDIILGLLPPTMGKVLADDLDIYKNLPTWQKEIGYIPQTIYLSDDTIRNNIAFGIDEKQIDEEAIERALKQAQLFEFVDSLTEGLDTLVGDRGVRLSGGQRQRIGIARALYHNPEVLVLDEATSALDTDTEKAVMEAIDNFKGEKTIIIIAHRLTTIKNADIVYEVADGKVNPKQ